MSEQHDYREVSDPAVMAVQPLVSVHMLAYRHEKFLAEAIEGVVAQVCDFPIELIIAEDCSPDRTLAIALDYQRRYPALIRIITGDKNVGMHANAARSMAVIRGKYVALCEGDDYWQHPHKLQMQVDAMSASDGITLCHTDYNRQIGSRIKRNQHGVKQPKHLAQGNAYEALLYAWSVMTATAMYRLELLHDFKASPFYQPTWPFGDYNLALFAAVSGRIAYLPESTATWRKVAGSATNENPQEILKMRLASLACRELFLAHYPVAEDTRKSCLGRANRVVMKYAFFAGNINAYMTARSNLIELGCKPSPVSDFFMRTSIRAKLPILAIGAMRKMQLHLTTD